MWWFFKLRVNIFLDFRFTIAISIVVVFIFLDFVGFAHHIHHKARKCVDCATTEPQQS